VAQGRNRVDQLAERVATENQGGRRLVRDRGRRAFGAVEQGELAEESPGPSVDDRSPRLRRGQHDLHCTDSMM